MPKTVLVIVGTRPEAVKMAPVILELSRTAGLDVKVCATGQHREMLDQALAFFGISADFDLNIMRPGQTLPVLTGNLAAPLAETIAVAGPAVVLVQGDTTSSFVGALAAFYAHVPVGHVEAGLRTGDLAAPFPEEANRQLTARLAHWHFAPTPRARQNLLGEGVPADRILVTGNTGVDALLFADARAPAEMELRLIGGDTGRSAGDRQEYLSYNCAAGRAMILVTGHRRESFGTGLESICRALADIADRFPDVQIIYPVHPNPNVTVPVCAALSGRTNIVLCEPVDYPSLVALMKSCRFIITDSGGIQEEAPTLGKPVLVTRAVTERPEALEAGSARLVGTDSSAILAAAAELLTDAAVYGKMARANNPFGDGAASARIVHRLNEDLRDF